MDKIPLVLLGLCSIPKEDLVCDPSELAYGTTIQLPGEFFEEARLSTDPSECYLLTHLQITMSELRPKETTHHGNMPSELQSSKLFLSITIPLYVHCPTAMHV